MAKGEEIKADFLLVSSRKNVSKTAVLDIPTALYPTCCVSQKVFTDNVGTDEFKNDVTSVIYKYPQTVSTVVLVLQQQINGVFTDVDTLNDNVNGTFYSFGFIVDDDNYKYIGYKLNWFLIYQNTGAGVYRVKTIETGISGVENTFSNEYCLSIYHANLVDNTVRFETYKNNIIGDISDPLNYFDFKDKNWYNSIRLDGIFGFNTSEYEREFVEYSNGKRQWIKDEQTEVYTLKLNPIDAETHQFFKTDILQSDEIFITDYNKNNANKHIQTPVIVDGSYEPRWTPPSKVASVDVKFKSAFNNLRKKRC